MTTSLLTGEKTCVLGLSRSVIYKQIRSGRLRSVKEGTTRLIPAEAIAEYIALLEAEAFAEYVHARAAFVGSLQPYGRLDPPMLMALDEVTQICPVPLPSWMADSAGKGILMVAICHGLAQLEARWDSAGARSIWDTASIKVILR